MHLCGYALMHLCTCALLKKYYNATDSGIYRLVFSLQVLIKMFRIQTIKTD